MYFVSLDKPVKLIKGELFLSNSTAFPLMSPFFELYSRSLIYIIKKLHNKKPEAVAVHHAQNVPWNQFCPVDLIMPFELKLSLSPCYFLLFQVYLQTLKHLKTKRCGVAMLNKWPFILHLLWEQSGGLAGLLHFEHPVCKLYFPISHPPFISRLQFGPKCCWSHSVTWKIYYYVWK